jgi:hypothetical protein
MKIEAIIIGVISSHAIETVKHQWQIFLLEEWRQMQTSILCWNSPTLYSVFWLIANKITRCWSTPNKIVQTVARYVHGTLESTCLVSKCVEFSGRNSNRVFGWAARASADKVFFLCAKYQVSGKWKLICVVCPAHMLNTWLFSTLSRYCRPWYCVHSILLLLLLLLLTALWLSPGGSSPTLVQTKIKIHKTTKQL